MVALSLIGTTHDRPQDIQALMHGLLEWALDFELIVIDDSPVMQLQMQQDHRRLSYLWSPHAKGPAESRNLGVQLSRGKRVMFLDDDDLVNRLWLEHNIRHADESQILFGDFVRNNNGHQQLIDTYWVNESSQMVKNALPVGSFSIPREVALQVTFDPELSSHEDWEYLLQVQCHAKLQHVKDIVTCQILATTSGRNGQTHLQDLHLKDYLEIYRRHPVSDALLARYRQELLSRKFAFSAA